MARNGSGTYNLPAGNPVVTGSTISSTWANNTLSDIGTALTGSIAKDGQTTPTANLPMGGYAHTSVADATVRTMYATAGQVQDSSFTLLTSVSGTNAITATGAIGMSAYVAGQRFSFVAAGANTGATTININAIGAKSITKKGTTALDANDIVSGGVYQIIYDGTQFQLLNPSAPTVTSFSAGTTGLTPSTGTTGAVTLSGTLAVANGGTGVTTSTGSGNVVLSTSPTLVTPALGTPSAIVLTNATGTANSLNAGIGVNQTWQDVSGSRTQGTSYQNTTGKPIMVAYSYVPSGNTSVQLGEVSTNNSTWITIVTTRCASDDDINGANISMIIPNNIYYRIRVSSSGTSTYTWAELR